MHLKVAGLLGGACFKSLNISGDTQIRRLL
jgi:hypothetical protein